MRVRVLLVGSGGREHALGWALRRTRPDLELVSAPGNPGLAELGTVLSIPAEDVPRLVEAARRERVDLVVPGPEAPLTAGLSDALRSEGIPCFGPVARAAALEGSKVFAKELLRACGAPTADFAVARRLSEAARAIERFGAPVVVKVDGLAGGKGVLVAATPEEALAFAARALSGESFGAAGRAIVVEQFLSGEEVSLFYWSNGRDVAPLPAARDYKRLGDGQTGPNTGGMGATAPRRVAPSVASEIEERAVRPVLTELARRGSPYHGILYCGIILCDDGPRVLEFNCRFGDPEAQALLPLADGDLAGAFLAAATSGPLPAWRSRSGCAVSVVLASEGYPDAPRSGREVRGVEAAGRLEGVLVFHGATRREGERLVSSGGRVLTVTGLAARQEEARERAYEALSRIELAGATWRSDIGGAPRVGLALDGRRSPGEGPRWPRG